MKTLCRRLASCKLRRWRHFLPLRQSKVPPSFRLARRYKTRLASIPLTPSANYRLRFSCRFQYCLRKIIFHRSTRLPTKSLCRRRRETFRCKWRQLGRTLPRRFLKIQTKNRPTGQVKTVNWTNGVASGRMEGVIPPIGRGAAMVRPIAPAQACVTTGELAAVGTSPWTALSWIGIRRISARSRRK